MWREWIISTQRLESTAMPWQEQLARETQRILPDLVQIRRHLHHCPELSNAEFETTAYLAEAAERGGLEPRLAADETSDGARHLIASGAIEPLGAILSVHVDPSLAVGTIGLREGVLTAGCDVFSATIEGRAGHGARPHLAADPIAAGAYWIDQAYRQVARGIDVRMAPALSVGRLHGGDAANAISDAASLAGTLRTTAPESREAAIEIMHRVARTAETLHGVRFTLHFENYTPAVSNDASLVHCLRAAASGLPAIEQTAEILLPSMGAEDFAFYLQELPGAMFRLGTCGGPELAHPLHSSCFDIDERAILREGTGAS